MLDFSAILNEGEARAAKATLGEIDRVLSSQRFFEPIVAGLPPAVVDGYRQALASRRADLQAHLDAYEAAKGGDSSELKRLAANDPAMALIVARIIRGYSQKELARRLGLKEQQIQRYEADRYRSISLSNYRRIAHLLGVSWQMRFSDDDSTSLIFSGSEVAPNVNPRDVQTIIRHARKHDWFDDSTASDDDEAHSYLQRYISDHVLQYGSPTLLRTGINLSADLNELLLIAWKTRVTRVAERIIPEMKIDSKDMQLTWLLDLVRVSICEDGPVRARDLLRTKGIILVAEPQISGLKLDGAAFLVDGTPVIGMTLRRDTIDNFWFTLMHEVAHVILHYKVGLRTGFFDDVENPGPDEVEQEANNFASNMLIPEEKWERSPARIAKSAEVVEKFAKELGIHPAIVFGRLQKERSEYAIFADKIGRGGVRKWLLQER